MVYATDLESVAERLGGSSPPPRIALGQTMGCSITVMQLAVNQCRETMKVRILPPQLGAELLTPKPKITRCSFDSLYSLV